MNDGGPAFPSEQGHIPAGMSLRAYFAGQAMEGLSHDAGLRDGIQVAQIAVTFADALIARLKDDADE